MIITIVVSLSILALSIYLIIAVREGNQEKEKLINKMQSFYKDYVVSFDANKSNFQKLINTNFIIPRCNKCFDEAFLFIEFNSKHTGMLIRCSNCDKQVWTKIDKSSSPDIIKDNYYTYNNCINEYYNSKIVSKLNDWNRARIPKNLNNRMNFYNDVGVLKASEVLIGIPDLDQRLYVQSNKNKKVNIVRNRPSITKIVKREVWQRDGGKCVDCGSKEKLEYDHIIPVSKGGANTVRNIQLLCESCNRKKSDRIE